MAKKILFLVLILLAIGGGFWYFWLSFGSKQPVNDSHGQIDLPKQESPVGVSGDSSKEKDIFPNAATTETLDLKALAMKIIEEPIIFKAQLLDSVKKQATDKINESISAIRENYDYPNAWYDLGAYRKLVGDYNGAIEAWNFIGLIRSKDYTYLNNLGDLYAFELKDYKNGEDSFLKAINNNPENINGYLQLATLYEYAYTEKLAGAENILLLGIQSNPKNVALKISLAQYYERNNRKTDALKYFEEVFKLDTSNNSLQEEISRLKNS